MFITNIDRYRSVGRNLIVLTGDTAGMYHSPKLGDYGDLQQVVTGELGDGFHVLSYDMNGVDFHDDESLEAVAGSMQRSMKNSETKKVDAFEQLERSILRRGKGKPLQEPDEMESANRLAVVIEKIERTDYFPLHSLALLRQMTELYSPSRSDASRKPLCILVRDAALLFPCKSAGDLTNEQVHRLQAFLNWMRSDAFLKSRHLIILVSDTLTDLSNPILQLPNEAHIEVPLPSAKERLAFIEYYLKNAEGPIGMETAELVRFSSGLPLATMQDVLDEAIAAKKNVTAEALTEAVNHELKKRLGDIVTFKRPAHGVGDVIAYEDILEVGREILTDCKNPATADSMVLFVGPNGGGKTYIAEALANWSGRVVIELSKIRDSLFGGTEKFFEQFRFVAESFDNLLVLMDEADAALSDVNSSQSHEVERRLTGGILGMASDKRYLGRLVWFLMTARAERLSSDVISRCGSVVPIFDLVGVGRRAFIKAIFERNGITLKDEELEELLKKTESFSNRDYDKLVRKAVARKCSPLQVLTRWSPGKAIRLRREYQEFLAADFSTYPHLVPERISSMKEEDRKERRAAMEFALS